MIIRPARVMFWKLLLWRGIGDGSPLILSYLPALLVRLLAFVVFFLLYLRRDFLMLQLLDKDASVRFSLVFSSALAYLLSLLMHWALPIVEITALMAIFMAGADSKMRPIAPVRWLVEGLARIRRVGYKLTFLERQEETPPTDYGFGWRWLSAFSLSLGMFVGSLVVLTALYAATLSGIVNGLRGLRLARFLPLERFEVQELIVLSLLALYAIFLEGMFLYYKFRELFITDRIYSRECWLY